MVAISIASPVRQTPGVLREFLRGLARLERGALELGSGVVFLVDSDLVVHPDTIEVLQAACTDIISEVFWTKWTPDAPELPNVWVRDNYTLFERAREELVDEAEEREASEPSSSPRCAAVVRSRSRPTCGARCGTMAQLCAGE